MKYLKSWPKRDPQGHVQTIPIRSTSPVDFTADCQVVARLLIEGDTWLQSQFPHVLAAKKYIIQQKTCILLVNKCENCQHSGECQDTVKP